MQPNKKILVISIIFGLTTLILVVLIIYPLFKGIRKSSEDLIDTKKDLVLFQGRYSSLEEIKEIYKGWDADLKRIDNLFVNSEVPIDLIKFWEEIAADLGILINISPGSIETAETDPWNSMGFQINLIASFSDFLHFFQKIETSPYLIEAWSLNIRKLSEQELGEQFPPDSISANLSIKVYTK